MCARTVKTVKTVIFKCLNCLLMETINYLSVLTVLASLTAIALVFTSQGIESRIDTLINARHKRKQKRQWTREGSHHVLQIRASFDREIFSEIVHIHESIF
jgi:hypothetical protein